MNSGAIPLLVVLALVTAVPRHSPAQDMTSPPTAQRPAVTIPDQDSDFDGLPDQDDPFPLIADYSVVQWEVNSVSLDYEVSHSLRRTAGVQTGESLSETKKGSFSWALGADGRIEAGLRGAVGLTPNPLRLFGLRDAGVQASLNAGVGGFARMQYSKDIEKTEQSDAKVFLSLTDDTTFGKLLFTFSVNIRNLSRKRLIMELAPVPILLGDRQVAEALVSQGSPTATVSIPADRRDGVLLSFRADLGNTRALEIVDYIRRGHSPTIDLARSRITLHASDDTSETDLISKLSKIETHDCLLTVRTTGGSVSWRVAPRFNFRSVTVRQAMEAINERVRKTLDAEADFFRFQGNAVVRVAGFQGDGAWFAQRGDDFRPLDHELLNSPLPTELHVTLLERKAMAEQEALVSAAPDFETRRSTLAGMTADLPAWKAGAEKGWPEAMVLLALCYTDGVAVPQDSAAAVKWFRKAADQGDARGQVWLGLCYRDGEGVARDPAEAVKWFRQAADQGDASGQVGLGVCYLAGNGVARDPAEAVKWFRKAADQGDASGQVGLGVCYRDGAGVACDLAEAVKWFRKAADQGNALGQVGLGVCYWDGEGVARDPAEAVKWFRQAADQGDARGQVGLGGCYRDGAGVACDLAEAVKWFRKAADQGDALGQFELGLCYRDGEGVARDRAEAVKWFRKAADQGHKQAQELLK
ncbi:MAG TPA: tetratricopeptide repeat protein [Verrucomicrobiota bacterium]|nr:tetratricopeptide repeat protein [Verrucomicrobiota bacterium]